MLFESFRTICYMWLGWWVFVLGFVVLRKSSAARAAHRELRSLLRLFRPVTPVEGARDRLVGTTRYHVSRQGVRAQIP
ncbi:hypothetical protein, partial [Pseudomonas kurunegalensis]|uniref:hypothetical protein n=1 Tax=Pseudomonas kurunegalensis TaxID=485880 RepID=UPI001E373F88